jgi:hypothetical protein
MAHLIIMYECTLRQCECKEQSCVETNEGPVSEEGSRDGLTP